MKGCLKVSDLNFKYPSYSGFSNAFILRELSFEPVPGGVNVVFGGPESGKSTLAMIIAALVPMHTGGEISGSAEIDGINLLKINPSEIIEYCGVVFQDPERQTVTTECFTEAAFALESIGLPEKDILGRVEKSFRELEIDGLLDAATSETSGGEKKKLALAGILSVNPDLWILDETFEELDNPSRIKLFGLLKESGKTVIIFSSKYFRVFEAADAFFLLEGGSVSKREGFPFQTAFKRKLIDGGIIPELPESRSGSSRRGAPLLGAVNLRYSYAEGGFKLEADHFELCDGETVSIVGRNGCGKSTLARLLCGLIEPLSGDISACPVMSPEEPPGQLLKVSSGFLNSFCAYMFQNPDYQIFLPTIYDELAFGLKEAGYSSSVIKVIAEKTIDEFKLPAADTPPALMSFSARKRLQAAVYYLLKRPVFILDEADTGLSFSDFIDLTAKLKQTCRGLIIITHNLDLASAVSDRVLGMSGGKIYDDILDLNPERINEWLTESGERPDDN